MQGSGGRRKAVTRNGVAAGSVWETRMRMDEVKGGIKVFNGDESRDGEDGNADEDGLRVYRRLRRNQSDGVAGATATEKRKRRSWRQPEAAAANGSPDKNPGPLRKVRSESANLPRIDSGENSREFGGEKTVSARAENAEEVGEKRVLLIGNGDEAGGGDGEKEAEEIEIEVEVEGKGFDDKEMDSAVEEQKNAEEEKRINQIHEIPVPPTKVEKKPTPVIDHHSVDPDPIKVTRPPWPAEEVEEMFESTSLTNRTQNIVDLGMWRDVSKSTFVFGFGTFVLVSSSYAKDLNFSIVSAISYLGLVYLALIFLCKSILRRGQDLEYDERVERYMVGEEEAIWILRLLLPYINELLSKLRALFSGDPATTMKLALLLFVMARCGSSITIWTLAKLVFFGVFTVPKVYSSYSTQLARYGKFWLERIRDGWESCTHKKGVAAGIFVVIWNLSSTVARVWAVFMLIVAVKFYQQHCVAAEDWVGQEEVAAERGQEDSKPEPGQGPRPVHRRRNGPSPKVVGTERKVKKGI